MGRLRPVVTVSDFSSSATCYSGATGCFRPGAEFEHEATIDILEVGDNVQEYGFRSSRRQEKRFELSLFRNLFLAISLIVSASSALATPRRRTNLLCYVKAR